MIILISLDLKIKVFKYLRQEVMSRNKKMKFDLQFFHHPRIDVPLSTWTLTDTVSPTLGEQEYVPESDGLACCTTYNGSHRLSYTLYHKDFDAKNQWFSTVGNWRSAHNKIQSGEHYNTRTVLYQRFCC